MVGVCMGCRIFDVRRKRAFTRLSRRGETAVTRAVARWLELSSALVQIDAVVTASIRRFVVVLPVRNGGSFLQLCVESVLAQSHEDFRLVVLDNSSTDGAVDRVRHMGDPRITVLESSEALSIQENWARILNLAWQDEYVTIIGHDDLLDPGYLEGMSALISANPDAALYQAHFRLIDGRGRTRRRCTPIPIREEAWQFLAARLQLNRDSYGTGYMFRASDYLRVGGIPAYDNLMFADDALWISLMMGSYKATEPRELFSYRLHRGGASHAPHWRATLGALQSYLAFLMEVAATRSEVHAAIDRNVLVYLRFWARWALFSARGRHGERTAILIALDGLFASVEPIVGTVRLQEEKSKLLPMLVGRLARPRWFCWQVLHYLHMRKVGRDPGSGSSRRRPDLPV